MINGQKMWTSLIQYADWIWLACRTDPDLPRHKGLSMILVPTDVDGFSYTPVHTVAGVSTSATYYEDVRVPAANLVGELNGGWPLITNQLNHERVSLTSSAPLTMSLKLVREWAQQTKNPDGSRVIDTEWVQIALGRAHAKITALTLINWKLASDADHDVALSPAEASATKIYGSELATEVYRSLMEVIGPNAGITGASDGAVLAGRIERFYRSALVMTFGGGTNEIQRDIIGYVGLGPAGSEALRGSTVDFTFTPEQDEAAELAAQILKDRATNERMKAVEAEGSRFDCELWQDLGRRRAARRWPSRRSTAAPGWAWSSCAGSWSRSGRTVAPVPLAAHGPVARLLAEHGSEEQKRLWLSGAATGRTGPDRGGGRGPRRSHPSDPTTVATPDGDGYRLTGSKAIVQAGPDADLFLVPAETPTGVGVFLVEPGDAG